MQEQEKASVSRRSLIRRAGTVAAGVGAAGIASTAVGSPALATDGQPIVQGTVNTGANATTTVANNSVDKPALKLTNTSGAPLQLDVNSKPVLAVDDLKTPVGSVFADDFGALYTRGNKISSPDGGAVTEEFIGRIAPAFTTSPVLQSPPERWLVTIPNYTMPNGDDGRAWVVPNSANYDSAGRVIPKNNPNVPDLVLDFSIWFYEYGLFGVQGNLAVMSPTANGFVALYDTPVWPGTASMNFQSGQIRDGFTQMGFTPEGRVNFKLSAPAIVVFDIFAFLGGAGTGRIFNLSATAGASAATLGRPTKPAPEFLPRKKK